MAEAAPVKATENPADKDTVESLPVGFYEEKDKQYLTYLQERLQKTWKLYQIPWPELNNKTIYQYYEENQKIANTHHVDPKKNEDDVVVSSGTIEEKLDALLSHVNNLNLTGELEVYNSDMQEIVALARGLEDIIHCTEINEPAADDGGDEEKRIARQRELMVQGTTFVQEEWLRLWERKKVLKNAGDKFSGKFKGVEWSDELEKVFEGPSRTQLYGPNVCLGDITEFYMERQPYLFLVIQQDYLVTRGKFGKFENWKYVQKGKIPPTPAGQQDSPKTIFDGKWRLTELKDNQVEIIMYQDQPNDEFQIIINGILMLPVGFPLSAVAPRGKYNIAKQVYRIINDKFAYGKSFVSSGSVKEISSLIDEMLRLFILKTRKSIMPAYANTSGRVIDRKVLSPGRISMGIDPGALQPIAGNEVQGITAGETSYLTLLRDLVDKSTVSNQFTGQRGKSGTTATEINTLQQQAQLTLGLTVAVCALLEKKLKYLRMFNVIENWFDPIGTKARDIDGVRKILKEYRRTSRNVSIDGAGMGERSVYVTDQPVPMPDVVRAMEIKEEKERGKPIRKVFINPTELAYAKLVFYWRVIPKERDSSTQSKLLFREQLADVIAMVKLGSRPNLDGIEEDMARVWGKPRNKLFQNSAPLNLAGVTGPSEEEPQSPDQILQGRGRSNEQGVPLAPGALATAGAE